MFLAQLTSAGTLSFHQNFKVGHLSVTETIPMSEFETIQIKEE